MHEKYKYNELTLTASSYNNKISVELPMDSDAHDVFNALKTLMIGLTFSEKAFNDAVAEYFYAYGVDKDDTVPATEMRFFTDGVERFRV